MPAHDSLDVWTEILHLDGFRVVHVHQDTPRDAVRLTVIPTTRAGVCPHCQRPSATIHRRHTSDPIRDRSRPFCAQPKAARACSEGLSQNESPAENSAFGRQPLGLGLRSSRIDWAGTFNFSFRSSLLKQLSPACRQRSISAMMLASVNVFKYTRSDSKTLTIIV